MEKYFVEIGIRGKFRTSVNAVDMQDAIEQAQERLDTRIDPDVDYEIDDCEAF